MVVATKIKTDDPKLFSSNLIIFIAIGLKIKAPRIQQLRRNKAILNYFICELTHFCKLKTSC